MTTEEIHHCGRCERRLKNPKAIELGYGKTCYKKVLAEEKRLEEMEQAAQAMDKQAG